MLVDQKGGIGDPLKGQNGCLAIWRPEQIRFPLGLPSPRVVIIPPTGVIIPLPPPGVITTPRIIIPLPRVITPHVIHHQVVITPQALWEPYELRRTINYRTCFLAFKAFHTAIYDSKLIFFLKRFQIF